MFKKFTSGACALLTTDERDVVGVYPTDDPVATSTPSSGHSESEGGVLVVRTFTVLASGGNGDGILASAASGVDSSTDREGLAETSSAESDDHPLTAPNNCSSSTRDETADALRERGACMTGS